MVRGEVYGDDEETRAFRNALDSRWFWRLFLRGFSY